jgi:hypothetical protein
VNLSVVSQQAAGGLARSRRVMWSAPFKWRMLGLVASLLLLLGAAGVIVAMSRHPAPPSAAAPARPAQPRHGSAIGAAAQTRDRAAAWVSDQVSRSAIVSCDPLMCQALEASHIPAGDLQVLRPGATDPLGSDVLVATAAIREQFGSRLATVYAPSVLARFGHGSTAVVIRAIAPGGARAYATDLRADVLARKHTGAALLHNKRVTVTGPAVDQLVAGQVDARLLGTLATLATLDRVHIVAFEDSAPGASPGVPLRAVELAPVGAADWSSRSHYARSVLAFLHQQIPPYQASSVSQVVLPSGQNVLRVEFAAPSPFGLIDGKGPS